MSHPEVKFFFHQTTNTCTYVVSDPSTKKAALIDTALDFEMGSGKCTHKSADELLKYCSDNNYTVDWILETHVHADHLTAAHYLKSKLPHAKIAIGENITKVQQTFAGIFNLKNFPCNGSQFDHLFKDDEVFNIGNIPVRVLYTPGHTPACICFLMGDIIFTGDTVFLEDLGTARCDFPSGSAHQMYKSAHRLLSLPDSTKQYVGHIYGADAEKLIYQTTIGNQKKMNIHVKEGITEEEYVKLREDRDKSLDAPKLLLPSLQVNISAGKLPDPEDNGVSYLKLPVKKL